MSGVWLPPGKQRFVDPLTGNALVGGLVYFYVPSTDTPKDTWVDQAQTGLNDNPITLDADGQCVVWGDGLYRQRLTDADGNEIWDQVTGFLGSGGGSVTFATPAQVAAGVSTDTVISPYALLASGVLGGGGGSGYGASKPLATYGTLDLSGVTVGANDTILTAAEADTTFLHFYGPAGTIRTNLTKDQLTKGYEGDASFITGPGAGDGAFRPPSYSYMAVKPSTWPVQGDGGFWRGDQRFTTGGQWKIIGPNVRTYDLTARYYESNTIPDPRWFDTYSGSSGVQAYLTSGANIGDTVITLNGPATLGWAGKTAGFANGASGTIVESHVISSVSGSTITLATPLTSAYVWNPSAGTTGQPCIYFAPRTWAGIDYQKIRHAGEGDCYGSNVRMNANYNPLPTEYHSFMTQTVGQYGGDVTFNADGVYGQFFESQLNAQTYDVTAIGFVGSFSRNVDTALDGGKFWAGTWFQSMGTRPADAGHVLLGNWRNGLDTVRATLEETSRLTVAGNSGDISITVASVNGAHPNDNVIIGSAETHVIQSINPTTKVITLTTNLAANYAIGALVVYPEGGAALNFALTHRIVWNSTTSSNARSGDPVGVYPPFYGNVQGDIIMGADTDGSSDFWTVRFARGTSAAAPDTSRIRLRPTGVQIFGTGGHTVAGTSLSLGAGCDFNLTTGQLFTLGPNAWITYAGGHIVGTINGGATYTTLV